MSVISRRNVLHVGLGLALAAPVATRAASQKLPKADAHYQYTPKGAQRCGLCASFIPGAKSPGPGACKIVDGDIPDTGWCELFSAK